MQNARSRMTLGEWTSRVFVALFLYVLFLGAWRLRDILLLAFFATILAIVLHVPVAALQRMGLPRGLSVLISLVGMIALVTMLVVLIVPVMAEQVSALANELPDLMQSARDQYDSLSRDYSWLPKINWDQVTEGSVPDFVMNQAGTMSREVFPFLSGVGGAITSLFFVLLIAIFFVLEPFNYLELLLMAVPRSYQPRALEIFHRLGTLLQRWFIGQMISMTSSGILIALTTGFIFKLPNAAALGVIAGVMEFVPNFGSIIALIPAIVIALAKDPILVPFVILNYLVVQQVQSNIIMPRIMSRQISMPAAAILLAQIIAGALFGVIGILLALPMAIVVKVLLREVYVTDLLNTAETRIETRTRANGTRFTVVTSRAQRPEQLSPGEAASLLAAGEDVFAAGEGQVVEIVTPPSPVAEQNARTQQVVLGAILALVAAQALALIHSLLSSRE